MEETGTTANEAAALKTYIIFLFFLLCNINTKIRYYKNMLFVCKFSQLILPNIIKIGQYMTE